ncbi:MULTISPECIES: amidohydrolase family protein [unclassified Streptomyces]|uniref:amidohydrolase family protein n=1 Tax=unclassified Streptomyces TaxID=2593676 RepID=UPI002DDBFDAA|nr:MULTISPECIES: amidohydrolase family protein [unclassified Streptomyces]WSA91209.1 amidohydrolase family protein [Streptomyces sp. NBC_01795]WSB75534.1 amidohydrolase family protein [Streptomyces sp. NBC_01775]WSS16182.1 amidohydrolase family protein [Streptomyces sp. NBC_01186]WSS45001.1 amidohydrolase family protein [Streptomyces sp. NBC_01187]
MTGTEHPPVFDAHAHLPGAEGATERLLEVMDSSGIARAVVVAGGAVDPDRLSRQIIEGGHVETDADNGAVLKGCARSGGRLVPFFFANPHRSGADYRAADERFSGLKLAPSVHGVGLLDARTTALVEEAGAKGHGVYLHCLQRPGFGVAELARLAGEFPAVTFVLGHGGVGDMDLYGIDLIRPRPNVLFETSGCFSVVVRAALDRLGSERVLLGTEYPLQHPAVELAKYRALNLSDEVWHRVTWQNTCRLIGDNAREHP